MADVHGRGDLQAFRSLEVAAELFHCLALALLSGYILFFVSLPRKRSSGASRDLFSVCGVPRSTSEKLYSPSPLMVE